MRRLKRVIITENLLIDLLSCGLLNREYISIPVNSSLPKDVKILSVDEDLARNALCVIIEHDSFDKVEDGREIPLLDSYDIEFKIFKVSDLIEVDQSKWYNNLI